MTVGSRILLLALLLPLAAQAQSYPAPTYSGLTFVGATQDITCTGSGAGDTTLVQNAVAAMAAALIGIATQTGSNCQDIVAIGSLAVGNGANTTANQDVFVGSASGANITTAQGDTAVGYYSLAACTSCSYNNAIGMYAMGAVTTGTSNTSEGHQSLYLADGSQNTVMGAFSMIAAGTPINDVAMGYVAGKNVSGSGNTMIGTNAGGTTLTTGGGNLLLGQNTDTLASNTSNEVNVAGMYFANSNSTAAPAVTAGGGSSPSIDTYGNNVDFRLTAGTGSVTTTTITFAGTGYSTFSHCIAMSETADSSFGYTYGLTTITLTATSMTSRKYDVHCSGV